MNSKFPTRFVQAFTLIELLVVISIIAVLAGGVGLALKGGNPGAALRGGQSTLISMLSAAKGQAALNQANSMIIVDADPTSETFLRAVRVVVEKTSGTWTEVGTPVILPQGVYIVPQAPSTFTESQVALKSSAAAHLSDFFTVKQPLTGITGTVLQSNMFNSLGALSSGAGGRLLVAAGTVTGQNAITINNDVVVRGLVLSKYGIPTQLNDVDSL
jgi:prepilin-type N-terminal cleavage/methylation domain-containing protein